MLLDSSITLLENICSTGVTHDDHHMIKNMFMVQATVKISILIPMRISHLFKFLSSVTVMACTALIALIIAMHVNTVIFDSVIKLSNQVRGSMTTLIGNGVEKLVQKQILIIDLNHYHIIQVYRGQQWEGKQKKIQANTIIFVSLYKGQSSLKF